MRTPNFSEISCYYQLVHVLHYQITERNLSFSCLFQADPRYVWNSYLLEELIEYKVRDSFGVNYRFNGTFLVTQRQLRFSEKKCI